MQPFQRPAIRDESRSEIVEQFRMRRLFTHRAELTRRRHKPAAKMMPPHSVHDDARGERSGVLDDRLREFEPSAAGGEFARLAVLRRECGEKAPLHHVAGLIRIAALLNFEIARLAFAVIEFCAFRSTRVDHVERRILDAVRHRHIEVRRVLFDRGDLLFHPLDFCREHRRNVCREDGRGLFLFQIGEFLVELRDFLARLRHRCPEFVRHRGHVLDSHTREHAGQPVVVCRSDRIGLVIMAPRAREREAEKGAPDGVHMLLPFVGDGALDDLRRQLEFLEIRRAQAEETERVPLLGFAAGHEVHRELPPHEFIVTHVVIQRLHHPVAVEPRRCGAVEVVGRLVGVARQIEPVSRPALAVVRRCQQRFHELRHRRAIRLDRLFPMREFLRARRQSEQIKIQPPDQHARRGRFRGLDIRRLHFCEEKKVRLLSRPHRVAH